MLSRHFLWLGGIKSTASGKEDTFPRLYFILGQQTWKKSRGIRSGYLGGFNREPKPESICFLCSKKNGERMLGLKKIGYGFHVLNISHATARLMIRINAYELCDKANVGIKLG
ncbi:hypothetical protein H112_04392 [Trichophyton rubrum D6]|uniref:Uncharacterized protein n=2 Tax=Trichophyton TaxID=5550 RepID=A0A022W232_TRIRU|nr:hypothetical protein H100_04401 [Trichophyton rubrum MR850]EZF41848.1 hypothetical protein H102_04385 [Trichophyton rubrum CBS 100081]EZF52520.1 hypothetical protein H103_04394 [Trichophyton rubrum CBS 288.86]EZF63010.1 hypothetical protein H104_04383 [Trichophyton rubrum CBS 289.86]EZF73761.1 hypothetical protein H105_04409 [Trichophyton soudanense CBS 452.61]EZF84432.1 hypothetical protein H110_04387 [Trichophyton rubrum MR1448]EZF95110.1 hypothetical protein H113_04428 [Trichophyton rub